MSGVKLHGEILCWLLGGRGAATYENQSRFTDDLAHTCGGARMQSTTSPGTEQQQGGPC